MWWKTLPISWSDPAGMAGQTAGHRQKGNPRVDTHPGETMAYLLLIVEPRGQRDTRTQEEARQLYDDMVRYGQGLAARGLLRASESLRPDRHGVRIQQRDGKAILRDGPFAEAKEMVGGFFLIDCATREEAIAIASACPAAQWATVEVREVAPCHVG